MSPLPCLRSLACRILRWRASYASQFWLLLRSALPKILVAFRDPTSPKNVAPKGMDSPLYVTYFTGETISDQRCGWCFFKIKTWYLPPFYWYYPYSHKSFLKNLIMMLVMYMNTYMKVFKNWADLLFKEDILWHWMTVQYKGGWFVLPWSMKGVCHIGLYGHWSAITAHQWFREAVLVTWTWVHITCSSKMTHCIPNIGWVSMCDMVWI